MEISSATAVSQKKQSTSLCKSEVGYLKLYSDKLQKLLPLHSTIYCFLHVTLSNFTKKTKRRQIVQESTLVAYLPTHFRETASKGNQSLNNRASSNSISRTEAYFALYEWKEIAIEPPKNEAKSTLNVKRTTKNKYSFTRYVLYILQISQSARIFCQLSESAKLHLCAIYECLEKKTYNASQSVAGAHIEKLKCFSDAELATLTKKTLFESRPGNLL